MNLIIDIGNTRTKAYVFKGNKCVAEQTFPRLSKDNLRKLFSAHEIENTILSSVVKTETAVISFLKKNTGLTILNSKTPLPLKNRYKTKETLGNDRIANACGAARLYPSRNCLVIDAGTCVKYDFVSDKSEYLGGAITPGLMMRYRSLNDYTAALPLLRPSPTVRLTGNDTKSAITSGVQLGMQNEMEGYIRLYQKTYGKLKVILTGGDAGCFAHRLNFPIFAAPQLTAIGLNEILQHLHPEK